MKRYIKIQENEKLSSIKKIIEFLNKGYKIAHSISPVFSFLILENDIKTQIDIPNNIFQKLKDKNIIIIDKETSGSRIQDIRYFKLK